MQVFVHAEQITELKTKPVSGRSGGFLRVSMPAAVDKFLTEDLRNLRNFVNSNYTTACKNLRIFITCDIMKIARFLEAVVKLEFM